MMGGTWKPRGCKKCICVRMHERGLQRRERLPRQFAGHGVRQGTTDQRSMVGRQMFRAGSGNTRYYAEGGREIVRFEEAEAFMWQSRQAMWGTRPALPGGAAAVLDAYFEQRSADVPARPTPSEALVRGVVLASRNSAPGEDGIPYELYHWGVSFVACLLREAVCMADDDVDGLQELLGPAVDLLVWIPKPDAGKGPSALRPLQLPTCIRRLYGAVITCLLGP